MLDEQSIQLSRRMVANVDRTHLQNLAQSTVQILRDPGWLLKWIGSLLIVIGVFMMFYLQPYRKQTEGEAILPSAPEPQNSQPEPIRAPAVVGH